MKRFSIQWLNTWKVDQTIKPAPFKGTYPTRLAIRTPKAVYLGKPNWITLQKLNKLPILDVIEFDRKNIIFNNKGTNNNLLQYYHPYWRTRNWWTSPSRTLKSCGQRVYARVGIPVTTEWRLAYKTFLGVQGIPIP